MTLADALDHIADLNHPSTAPITVRATREELLEISLALHERKLRLGRGAAQYARIIAALARIGEALSSSEPGGR